MEQENKKDEGIFCFIMNKIINPDGLFESGKFIILLILGSIAIQKWLEVCGNIPNITVRAIGYSSTILIPIYLSKDGFNLILEGEKN